MTTVLFACVHNAGRSQMAAAFFNALANPQQARAISAGTQPARHVHPEVVVSMRDVGLDVAGAQRSRFSTGTSTIRRVSHPIASARFETLFERMS